MPGVEAAIHADMALLKPIRGGQMTSETGHVVPKKSPSTNSLSNSSSLPNSEYELKTPPNSVQVTLINPTHKQKSTPVWSSSSKETDTKPSVHTSNIKLDISEKSGKAVMPFPRYTERRNSMVRSYCPEDNVLNPTSNRNQREEDVKDQVVSHGNTDSQNSDIPRDNPAQEKLSNVRSNSSSKNPFLRGLDGDWNIFEEKLRRLKTKGYDPDRAIMTMLSSYSKNPTSSRIDWRLLTKMTNHSVSTNNDFFSMYPWSMRKKYSQNRHVHSDAGDEADEIDVPLKTSSRVASPCPSRPVYVQNARGFVKKEISKTPGELAMDLARIKNCRKHDMESITSTSRQTSTSLPNIRQTNSNSGNIQNSETTVKLPDIGGNHPIGLRQTYLQRHPMNINHCKGVLKTAYSVPSISKTLDNESCPLKVKNCNIPAGKALSFTPASSAPLCKSTSDISNGNNSFPLVLRDKEASESSQNVPLNAKPLTVRKMNAEQQISLHTLMENLNARRESEPPKPPPVTPNVKLKSKDGSCLARGGGSIVCEDLGNDEGCGAVGCSSGMCEDSKCPLLNKPESKTSSASGSQFAAEDTGDEMEFENSSLDSIDSSQGCSRSIKEAFQDYDYEDYSSIHSMKSLEIQPME